MHVCTVGPRRKSKPGKHSGEFRATRLDAERAPLIPELVLYDQIRQAGKRSSCCIQTKWQQENQVWLNYRARDCVTEEYRLLKELYAALQRLALTMLKRRADWGTRGHSPGLHLISPNCDTLALSHAGFQNNASSMAREVSFVKMFPANSSHTRNLSVHGEERQCSPERENADLK